MWKVYDNERLCDFGTHPEWKNASFDTLEDAAEYARKWFGIYTEGMYIHQVIKKFCTLDGWDYSGYGDIGKIVCND